MADYSEAQLRALKQALLGVVVLTLVSFAFMRHLPHDNPVAVKSSPDAARRQPAAAYSALNSVGLFSHERVENRHNSLGGSSTLSAGPCLVASATEAGASSR